MTPHQSPTLDSTVPIRTKLPLYPFYGLAIIASMFIGFGVYWMNDQQSWSLKSILITLPFFLWISSVIHRKWRLRKIKQNRFAAKAPYYWEPGVEALPGTFDCQHLANALLPLPNNIPFLFLIEQLSKEDHQTKVYDLLCDQLAQAGHQVDRYYYQGDLCTFWQTDTAQQLTLEALTESHPKACVIIGGDAHRLFQYKTGQLHNWSAAFSEWKKRIILTNVPVDAWDEREANLATVFTLIPFTSEGLAVMRDYLNGKTTKTSTTFSLDPTPPKVDNPKDIAGKLAQYYGADLSRWIAATAICSQVSLPLTFRLGKKLNTPSSHLLSCENLLLLSRLPWYRNGQIPDKGRIALLAVLPSPLQIELRNEVVLSLEPHPPEAPSHAHNHYRMELAGHKLLLPGFSIQNLKNELYELRSLGYREDVAVTHWLDMHQSLLQRLVPRSMESSVYREGSILLGWKSWLMIPLLLVFSGGVIFSNMKSPFPAFPQDPNKADTTIITEDREADVTRVDVIETPVIAETEPEVEPVIPADQPAPPPTEKLICSGRVVNLDHPPQALKGVRLSLLGQKYTTRSNGKFEFRLTPPLADNAHLTLSSSSYFSKSIGIEEENVILGDVYLTAKEIRIHVVDNDQRGKDLSDVEITGEDIKVNARPNGRYRVQLGNQYSTKKSVNLKFKRRGYRDKKEAIRLQSGTSLVFLQKKGDLSIIGKVMDADSDRPLSGVAITVFPEGKNVSSGSDGTFKFTMEADDDRSEFQLELSKTGYQDKKTIFKVGTPILLSKKTRYIRGNVYRMIKQYPLKGVRVEASEFQGTDLTKSKGEFSIKVPNSFEGKSVELSFEIKGCETVVRKLKIPSKGNSIVLSNCEQSFIIGGEVKDVCGNKIVGASIEFWSGKSRVKTAKTNRYGAYNETIELPFGQQAAWTIKAKKNDFHSKEITHTSRNKSSAAPDILMVPALLKGKVQDENRRGLGQVQIKLVGTKVSASSSPQGDFEMSIPKSHSDCYVELVATKSNYKQSKTTRFRLDRTAIIKLNRQVITIKGKVTKSDGKTPIEKVSIKYRIDKLSGTLNATDSKGRFEKTFSSGSIYNKLNSGKAIRLSAERTNYITTKEQFWRKGGSDIHFKMLPKPRESIIGEERKKVTKIPSNILKDPKLIIKQPTNELTLIIQQTDRGKTERVGYKKVSVYSLKTKGAIGSGNTDKKGLAKIKGDFRARQKIRIKVAELERAGFYLPNKGVFTIPSNKTITVNYKSTYIE